MVDSRSKKESNIA
jgi:ATP-dependent RNA helicase